MEKNWAQIARIKNSYVRYALIQATGDDVTALALAYPECFCKQYDRIEYSRFLLKVKGLQRYDTFLEACQTANLPYHVFHMKGAIVSSIDNGPPLGLPHDCRFYHSGVKQGGTLTYMGSEWVVVWNYHTFGNNFDPAEHILIIVPKDALRN